ncbi:hypothetical protein FNV43_RR20967 [Rhamnella rubrinervis]|uniref:Uncharacterized protein n=1 Tax=Rhamnella rubrinervis TaxID=2594499 RepID=A0A8K0GQZ4_9ROSA|nr:hypothetical protein FNV43_RR20967 [Rhamnella rubrinervis]
MITSADRRGLSAGASFKFRLSTFDGRIVAYYGGGGWRRGLIRRAREAATTSKEGGGSANYPIDAGSRASVFVTLKKLECSKQAYALDTLAWDNIIGFGPITFGRRDRSNDYEGRSGALVFHSRRAKVGGSKAIGYRLVSTISDAEPGMGDVTYRTPRHLMKSKSLG